MPLKTRVLLLAAGLAASLLPLPAGAAASVGVLTGTTPDTRVMPSNAFTVPDATQLTGLRVNSRCRPATRRTSPSATT